MRETPTSHVPCLARRIYHVRIFPLHVGGLRSRFQDWPHAFVAVDRRCAKIVSDKGEECYPARGLSVSHRNRTGKVYSLGYADIL
jgi:hypothetical protein